MKSPFTRLAQRPTGPPCVGRLRRAPREHLVPGATVPGTAGDQGREIYRINLVGGLKNILKNISQWE